MPPPAENFLILLHYFNKTKMCKSPHKCSKFFRLISVDYLNVFKVGEETAPCRTLRLFIFSHRQRATVKQ